MGLLVRTVLGTPWTGSLLFGIPMGLYAGPISLSAWYVSQATPAAQSGPLRSALTAIVASLVAAALWAAVGRAWWRALDGMGSGIGNVERPGLYPLLIGIGALGYLLAIAAYQTINSFETSAASSRRALESDVAQREAELRALRAQIDPHFLFNSLNSIAGLITGAPDQAREMCQLLGDFLRQSMQVTATSRIPLSREVLLIEQYLRIEQVRFGTRLATRITVGAGTADVEVPALLLQPLVENAVRHGVGTRLEGGTIEIETRRAGGTIVIAVTNPRDPDARRGGTGQGLDIVRRRLAATFGGLGTLTVSPAPESFRVSVTLPAGDQS